VQLSKRGILDEGGIYLTENGSEAIKKIKIKPAPVRRARPIKSNTIRSNSYDMDMEHRNDKNIDDEASRSSSEEKMDLANDENKASFDKKINMLGNNSNPQLVKRQVLIGL
jgi:hypothetical protein